MSSIRSRVAPIAIFVLMIHGAGCAGAVKVRRADPRAVLQDLTRSVLTTGDVSAYTHNVLHRHDFVGAFAADPDGVLASLHQSVVDGREGSDAIFALAELSFVHAERDHRRAAEREIRLGHFLAAAVYAYAFLFPEDPDQAPSRFDPRVRVASDLYNRGVTLGLPTADDRHVALAAGSHRLPFGTLAITFDAEELRWGDRRLKDFIAAAELDVHGLTERYRRPGLGVPLAAATEPYVPGREPADFVDPATRVPVTALLRLPAPRAQLVTSHLRATLELHDAHVTETVTIGGRVVPLEVEPTAALAYMLAEVKFWDLELDTFLGRTIGGRDPTRLMAVQPYRRGRIPVVLVHGTGSSPGRWADMVNDLLADPRIRAHFQFWYFTYDSGNPILYSAGGLRELLTTAVDTLDHDDPALRRMVVIGHSQGGLLTKLTAIDAGDKLWTFRKPFDQMRMSERTRAVLRRIVFIEPLPFVKRVVFIATPHGGSYMAGSWIAHRVARLIKMPGQVLDVGADLVKGNPDLANWRMPNAVDNMTPRNPLVKALNPIPVAPGTAAHSIVAVQGPPPYDDGTDGVVRYASAHRSDVDSEVVVRSPHSCQSNPATVAEVRRILLLHLAEAVRDGAMGGDPAAGERAAARSAY